MNILHIGKISDDRANGVSVVVPKHLEYQSKYTNITLLNLYDFVPKNADKNYRVVHSKSITTLRELLNKAEGPDLVVFHEIYRPFFIKAYKEVLRKKIPYVIIPHGSLTKGAQLVSMRKKQIGNFLFFDNFVKHSSKVQYMSETERQQSKVSKHPYFVQGSGINIVGHKKQQFSKEGLKLIYVGRLDVQVKGLDILLAAASENKPQFIQSGVTITIAGPDTKDGHHWLLNTIDKHNLDDIVKVEGPVYGKAKIKKLLEHDLFVQLSRTEAQCLGLMEAMDIGLPCIVSPGSTFFEIAKKHKVAIPCIGDSRDAGKAILSAVQSKQKFAEMSSKASAYINDNYDWDKVGQLMVEQYQEILNSCR